MAVILNDDDDDDGYGDVDGYGSNELARASYSLVLKPIDHIVHYNNTYTSHMYMRVHVHASSTDNLPMPCCRRAECFCSP